MHKCACELDQPLVKISVQAVPVFEPDVLEDFVRLEIFPPVEQLEITSVMRVECPILELPGHGGDAFTLLAHVGKVMSKAQSQKSKVVAAATLDIGLVTADSFCHSAFMSKPALGRGLGALLGGNPVLARPAPTTPVAVAPTPPAAATDDHERVRRVPLNRIRPCPLQPRKDFSDEALRELADSIREQGIVQPLIVRERGGNFELIAGERRWRAAQLLNLLEVPVIAREADDRAVLELALIENLQRENLNAIEEAHGYAQLAEQFQLTQEDIAAKVGKSRAVVANALRLLKLPDAVQKFIRDGRLSVGHGKVILGLGDEKLQQLAAERVIKEGLNVRQAEGLVAKLQARGVRKGGTKLETVASPAGDPHVADLEAKLREVFATKVKLNYAGGKGTVEISFFSEEELERILQILGVAQG
jgi:ParB family chromosome partitioning protein